MKKLAIVAVTCWALGVVLILVELVIGPGPAILGVYVLWAPAAVWGWLRYTNAAVRVVTKDEWYTAVENPKTYAEAMQNLSGALGNLARSLGGRKPPTDE